MDTGGCPLDFENFNENTSYTQENVIDSIITKKEELKKPEYIKNDYSDAEECSEPPDFINICDNTIRNSDGQDESEEEIGHIEDHQNALDYTQNALMALTSHFAKVQLRLRQIVDAPLSEKETMLRDLEEFAFRAIPEVHTNTPNTSNLSCALENKEENLNQQKAKQKELITQLKSQLEDLEKYAYETGEAGLPQSLVIERQKIILDQLKGKLNLNIDQIDKLTVDDLRAQVDSAIGQVVQWPCIMLQQKNAHVSALYMTDLIRRSQKIML